MAGRWRPHRRGGARKARVQRVSGTAGPEPCLNPAAIHLDANPTPLPVCGTTLPDWSILTPITLSPGRVRASSADYVPRTHRFTVSRPKDQDATRPFGSRRVEPSTTQRDVIAGRAALSVGRMAGWSCMVPIGSKAASRWELLVGDLALADRSLAWLPRTRNSYGCSPRKRHLQRATESGHRDDLGHVQPGVLQHAVEG